VNEASEGASPEKRGPAGENEVGKFPSPKCDSSKTIMLRAPRGQNLYFRK